MLKKAIKKVIVFCIIFSSLSYVKAQFLVDDYKKTEQKQNQGLPPYIARNIKAEIINEVEGAVRITFSVVPDSKYDFLVGRTSQNPSSPEIALKATTVKIILAGAEPVVIDSNLQPGQYYYVVLARDKVLEKDIQLYPDVNYTSVPVVIKKKIPEIVTKRIPEQVTLLYARVVNKTQVLLTWKGVQKSNVTYNIYRSLEPLNIPERIKNAKLVGTVPFDRESFIDRSISQSGKYYYAVTVQDVDGNEDIQLIPDQSFTVNPVSIIIRQDVFVTNIQAQLEDGVLKLTWSKPGVEVKSFAIYRYSQPIADAQILAMSTRIATVDAHITEYVDNKPLPGTHFFAVLSILSDDSIDTTLKPDSNYTTKPLVVGAPIKLEQIRAYEDNGRVRIVWSYSGSSGSRYYKLFRSNKMPVTVQDINDSFLVDVINITKNEYIDNDIPAGIYYYVLVPENYDIDTEFKIISGINCTLEPVKIVKKSVETTQPITPQNKEIIPPPKPELKKEEKPGEQKQQKFAVTSDVDTIIARTFYKGQYESCINELNNFILHSNNPQEIAKANLYIGRCYIELKQYKQSLKFLVTKDVITYYPKESKFWREFALSKIK